MRHSKTEISMPELLYFLISFCGFPQKLSLRFKIKTMYLFDKLSKFWSGISLSGVSVYKHHGVLSVKDGFACNFYGN